MRQERRTLVGANVWGGGESPFRGLLVNYLKILEAKREGEGKSQTAEGRKPGGTAERREFSVEFRKVVTPDQAERA